MQLTTLSGRRHCPAASRTGTLVHKNQWLLQCSKRQRLGPRISAEAGQRGGATSVTTAPPGQPAGVSAELWELHEELLKEIEERKQYQAALLEKLNQIQAGPDTVSSTNGRTPASPFSTPNQASTAVPNGRALAPPALRPSVATPPPPRTTVRPAASPPVITRPAPTMQPPAPKLAPPQPPPARAPPAVLQAPPPLPAPAVVQPALPVAAPPPVEEKPPPLAGANVMNIVMVGAECAPWSKTGGLGDVMGALPKALANRGHRVMVVAPRYANYDDAWETGTRARFNVFNSSQEVGYFHSFKDGVDYVFVDHACYHNRGKDIYGGDRQDIMFRCALLSKAALEAVWHVPCGGVVYGDENLCFIANDWHTALLPVYLQAHYRDYDKMTFARSVFVIHNMAHQGRAPFADTHLLELNDHYRNLFMLDDPIGGEHMNIMKAGLQLAQRIVAVSHGYAWECKTPEGGWGLHMVLQEAEWKMRGIVNGIDYNEWSPTNDAFLDSDGYQRYDMASLAEGKAACKAALQRELGLPVDPSIPLLGFIGRLDYQKGVDLICDNYDWLMGQNVQLVLLGSGRDDLESMLRDMENRNKQRCRSWVGFSVKMAHRITAGCDILLMPSRFEPCGLNQLYAMAYGTVPVVHAVGGLRDTVKPYNPFENSGTGWTFDRAEAPRMRDAVANALVTYREYRPSFTDIQLRGMAQDLSWDNAAQQYEEVLVAAKYQW